MLKVHSVLSWFSETQRKLTWSFCPVGAVGTILVALSLASKVITHAATIKKPREDTRMTKLTPLDK